MSTDHPDFDALGKDGRRRGNKYQAGPIKDGLNEFYLDAIKGMPSMREALGVLIAEVNEKGATALQSLEREIMMQMVLVKMSFEDLGRIPETDLRARKSHRREVSEQLEKLRELKETNAEFYYGSKYAVRLDQVHDFLKVVMQIILSNVRDPQVLRKIAGQIDQLSKTSFKSDVTRIANTIEVQNVAKDNEGDMGVDKAVAVGNSGGNTADRGPDSDAGVPLSDEGASAENKGDRPTTEQG